MLIKSEAEMLAFGENFAKSLSAPATLELIGDVGAGKTTFVRGLARGLGVKDAISSPSFTISRSYHGDNVDLNHYDFYRLQDPGLMADDFRESIHDPHTITVVEWGESVASFLPENHQTLYFHYQDNADTREVTVK